MKIIHINKGWIWFVNQNGLSLKAEQKASSFSVFCIMLGAKFTNVDAHLKSDPMFTVVALCLLCYCLDVPAGSHSEILIRKCTPTLVCYYLVHKFLLQNADGSPCFIARTSLKDLEHETITTMT